MFANTSVWIHSPPPTSSERRHRHLGRRLVAVRRRAVFVLAEGKRPHPWHSDRRGGGVEDAADHDAIGEHVEVHPLRLAQFRLRAV
jgi:hypothetical protein